MTMKIKINVYLLLLIGAIKCYVMTENQIKEDIKFLSQTGGDGVKPSRLRALLLADLKKALPKVFLFLV